MTKWENEVEIRNPAGVMGLALHWRGRNDPHVLITLLGEDDEHWWAENVRFSSAWLDDYIKIFQNAKAVLENSPNFKPDIVKGIQYGYKFTDDQNMVTLNLEGN